MDTTFAIGIGIGAGADSVEYFDFAKDALSAVSQIAVDLGAHKKLCVAGCLAAKLLIARKTLELADASQLPKVQRRLPKLLRDLERICVWPELPDPHFQLLRSMVSPRGKLTNERVRRGILGFAKSSPNVIDQYFKNLDRFSKQALAEDEARSSSKANGGSKVNTEEYPAHVNAELYAVLKAHSLCTCLAGHVHGRAPYHDARLRLREDIVKVDGHVAFDMLFSASPSAWDHWQDLQLRVPMRKKAAKAVRFSAEDSRKISGGCPDSSAKRMRVVKASEFCSLVKSKLGSQICCHVQDSELHQLYDGFPVVQNVGSGPSFSLRKVLEKGRLSNRMKLVLAYIVARSYWQYYDSPWMDPPWTSDSIHFLREPPTEEDTRSGGALYASKPYFAVAFQEIGGESAEYCSTFGVIFRYPRLLSLCIILLEIGRGQSLRIEDHGSVAANLNAKWTLAKRLTSTTRSWGDFDYPHYLKAIVSCLNYTQSVQADATIEMNAFARKAAIRDVVVQPLEKLLSELGFAENLHIMDPIGAFHSSEAPNIPAVPAMPTRSSDVDLAARWLDELNVINQYFQKRSSPAAVKAPRVAVLDTGFDSEAVFFNMPGRSRRIKGWRDWVDNSETPVDDNGHGSHTMATVMKVAPNATIYAARISKDRSSLKNAGKAIAEVRGVAVKLHRIGWLTTAAKAIDWAVNEVEADIVTMSFGFQDEVPIITEAIIKAILERKGKIIFFAAASNSGGNRREMFPANHDYVVSIRETNTRGAFSDTNPPVDPDGPAVFGTLGREVPSAWLSSVEGEVAKSGSSVATAVAAGIAAMVLTIVGVGLAEQTVQMPTDVHKLWTKRGMQKVLERMSQNMGNRSYFISPVGFFHGRDAEKTWTAIADACTR